MNLKRWDGVGLAVCALGLAGWGVQLLLRPMWWAFAAALVTVVVVGAVLSPKLASGDRRAWVHWTTELGATLMVTWIYGALVLLFDATFFPLGAVGVIGWLVVVGSFLWFVGCALGTQRRTVVPGTDAVVVLGAGLAGDRPGPLLANRCRAGAAACPPGTTLIVSGGQGPDEPCTEADAMSRFLIDEMGYRGGVEKEPRAANTEDNINFSLDMLGDSPTIALFTSDFHVLRTEGLVRDIQRERDFEAYVIGAPTPVRARPAAFLREFVAYWLWRKDR